jgi:hypothetical protein
MGRIEKWDFTKTLTLEMEGGNNANTPIKFTALVRFYGYNDPGRISGPPENCYPPESENTYEVLEVTLPPGQESEKEQAMEIANKAAADELDGLEIPDNEPEDEKD